jgi:sulfur-carrier protein adenylyltransferase/sulfurtransferase
MAKNEDSCKPDKSGSNLLTAEQMERYSRHTRLGEVGVEGQRKLLDAKVLILGAGGLGSPAALYLAAAGIGTIGIIDGDRVDRSNLQRQVLHDESWLGKLKVDSARARIEKLNPDVRVETYPVMLRSENALDIVEKYDLVVNGCDNFPTRYLINDACVLLEKPLVDAAIMRFEGQAMVYAPGRGCYRCLFPTPPPPGTVPNCAEVGVFGALAGQFGTLQAMQTVKIILGIGEVLINKLYYYSALDDEHQTFNWEKRENCPVCGDNPTITELIDYEDFCGIPAVGGEEGKAERTKEYDLNVEQAMELLSRGAKIIDVREAREYGREHIPNSALIPLGELPERVGEIESADPILVVCQIGERSGRAVNMLREAGFKETYNLAGGMIAWVNHRQPVEKGKEQSNLSE